MIATIIIIAEILGILSAIDAVMTTRTSQGAIGWAVSLIAIPYVAVPAYWILGRRKFEGYVESRREHEDEIDTLRERFLTEIEPALAGIEEGYPELKAVAALATPQYKARDTSSLRKLGSTRFNSFELLVDGEQTFDSILEGIDAAEEYVIFQFYIIRADDLGIRVKDKLIEKARQGVRVYFLYDEVGSHSLPRSHTKELRDAGVRVSAFNTTQGRRNRFQINFRNHRKTVVVDGHTTWIGGHNVGDEYLGLDPKFGPWRDTHIKIVGPAAIFAQIYFVGDWYWATRELPEFRWGFDPERAVDDRHALILGTSPADARDSAQLFFVHALNAAKKSIWIATPYFVPDEAVIAALQLAVLRGVEVKVIIPQNPDSLLVQLSAFSFVDELGDDGIEFYSYTEGFMHQKVTLIDEAVSTIGTANFDNRSFRLNFEITAVILDHDFAARVKQMLEADLARSVPLDPEILRQKPFYFRLGVRIARLMAPIQ